MKRRHLRIPPKTVGEILIQVASTAQKMKFSIKDLFSKCDQIRSLLRIWSHLLKKYLMENFILCAVRLVIYSTFAMKFNHAKLYEVTRKAV